MYNHFPDKDTLLVEYAIHETADYISQLKAGIDGAASPREAVAAYVRTQLDLTVSFHMPHSMSRNSLTEETASRMREHVVMIEDVLRQIVREGVASGDFASDLAVDSTVRIINALLVGSAARSVSRPGLPVAALPARRVGLSGGRVPSSRRAGRLHSQSNAGRRAGHRARRRASQSCEASWSA